MKRNIILLIYLFGCLTMRAQTNYLFTNPKIEPILKGNYSPGLYNLSGTITPKTTVTNALFNGVIRDSLLNFLTQLASFTTRNTGSDTLSSTLGIGAARRWAHAQFERFSAQNQNRLQVSYFQFDKLICTVNQHRNIMAVLPGNDTSEKEFIIIEAHIDTRCEGTCDTLCLAQGVEDNASGSSLVLELARVLSPFTFKRTLVFILSIGEEQGLDGAEAFAKYAKANNLKIRGMFNNDVVGGVICGKTSAPPGCPFENDIDSINVRIFSAYSNYSNHKGLARFIKLEFEEEMKPKMPVKTSVNIMNAEDRTGRGGDHIRYREQGFTAIRITSANEHGDANPQPGYLDRQHSTRDILGKDINNDGFIDSFYVNTGYLQRNCWLNGTAAIMAANGPNAPDFDLVNDGNGLSVIIKNPLVPNNYKIGFRTRKNDFDTIFTLTNQTDLKTYHVKKDSFYFVSVARMDDEGVESLFATEKYVKVLNVPASGIQTNVQKERSIQLLPVIPNPIDETLSLSVWVKNPYPGKEGMIEIFDMQGKLIKQIPISLSQEINEVVFEHGFNTRGLFNCTLFVDGYVVDTQKIFFK